MSNSRMSAILSSCLSCVVNGITTASLTDLAIPIHVIHSAYVSMSNANHGASWYDLRVSIKSFVIKPDSSVA